MIISISRIIYRQKHPYVRKYSSTTRFFYEVGGKRFERGTNNYKSYKHFITAVKNKYGVDAEYKIDYSQPYVIYL